VIRAYVCAGARQRKPDPKPAPPTPAIRQGAARTRAPGNSSVDCGATHAQDD
jgi:hypothetical protein